MSFINVCKKTSEKTFIIQDRIRVKKDVLLRFNLDFGSLSFYDEFGTNGKVIDLINWLKYDCKHYKNTKYKYITEPLSQVKNNVLPFLKKCNQQDYVHFQEEYR